MATYIVSDDGFCPTCRSKEVFHVLSDEVRSGRIPAMHRFLLRNERAVVASDLMKTNGRQDSPTMICALCFGNSSLGGFHINWQLTNLETIFCVSPETLASEEHLPYDQDELLHNGEKTLQKIIQADSNRKSGSNQVFTKRVTDKDSAGNDTGDTQQLHDAHPYMKYLANQISETSKPDSAATTPELSKKKDVSLMSQHEVVYPISVTGACPYCQSHDILYIILVPPGEEHQELPPLLTKLVSKGCAFTLKDNGRTEVPSFQCRQCGYGFNLDWTAASLESVFEDVLAAGNENIVAQSQIANQAQMQERQQVLLDRDVKETGGASFTNIESEDLTSSSSSQTMPPESQPFVTKYKEYAIPGNFNVLTGKFQRLSETEHWAQKGLPTDRDIRQLAHYMDVSSADTGEQKKKQVKLTAKQIQKFKKVKEEKKRKKLLQAYFDQ